MARAALPPLVLVTNDDGVGAPGISALVRALARGGRFRPIVCAPARDRSGVSHSLTIHGALKAERAREPGVGELASVACHGSPADCIGFALSGVPFGLPEQGCVAVVSGVNRGTNCGSNVVYSGTLSGAREATMRGVPVSLAVSTCSEKPSAAAFDIAAEIAAGLLVKILADRAEDERREQQGGPSGVTCPTAAQSQPARGASQLLLSINVPSVDRLEELKGIRLTRQGDEYIEPFFEEVLESGEALPEGHAAPPSESVAPDVTLNMPPAGEGTRSFMNRIAAWMPTSSDDPLVDSNATASGYVSCTAVQIDQGASPGNGGDEARRLVDAANSPECGLAGLIAAIDSAGGGSPAEAVAPSTQ